MYTNVMLTHLPATAGQRHSAHKNECEDCIYFFAKYIVTNIIIAVINLKLYVSLLDIHFIVN
jgi:hypothetical protein